MKQSGRTLLNFLVDYVDDQDELIEHPLTEEGKSVCRALIRKFNAVEGDGTRWIEMEATKQFFFENCADIGSYILIAEDKNEKTIKVISCSVHI